jgi:hypothetical protein
MDRQAEQPDPEIGVAGVSIQGLNSLHGPVVVYFLFGLIRHETAPGPGERVGLGSLTDMSAFGCDFNRSTQHMR